MMAAAVLLWRRDTRNWEWNDCTTRSPLWYWTICPWHCIAALNSYNCWEKFYRYSRSSAHFSCNIKFNMKTLQKYRERSLWAPPSIGPFTQRFFEKSCNSAAKRQLCRSPKILRNLQNKDILLADEQGCCWKMVSKGFICYIWLLSRGIKATHSNTDSDCTSEMFLL